MSSTAALPFSDLAHPLALLLPALLLDAAIGDPVWLYRRVPHPVAIIGRLIAWLERRLNRPQRSTRDRMWRGLGTVIVVVGLAAAVGVAIARLAAYLRWGWVIELVLVAILIAQRNLFDHVRRVASALREGGLAPVARPVAHLVGRDPASLDRHGVARAAIESLAENFSDGVVAPVFWFALLGLPGLLAYKAINTLDSMIGHRNARYAAFGLVAARLDDAVNFIPARLAGLLMCAAAAFVPSARPLAALRTMVRDARYHRSPNAGWPEAAVAGALDLALAGPRQYGTTVVKDAWMGDGRARADDHDIRRALALFIIACILNGLAVTAALWLALV